MNNREQPDPGDGWRLASGDDWKDVRCEIWCAADQLWVRRFNVGLNFCTNEIYRIPIDAPQPDLVNSPPHYRQGDIECIDAIRAALTEDQYEGYLRGACMKYLWRYNLKGGVESLRKANWHLDRLISHNEKKRPEDK